jgi:hypothetical protein
MKIRKAHLIACWIALASVCVPGAAQTFKQYPGSKLDEKASRQGSTAGAESQVYTTNDSFDKVFAFYKGLYKEFSLDSRVSHSGPSLPSGKTTQWAFFILDGEKDLAHSKLWMKIQRPFILKADMKDIRDVSVIQTVRKR